MGLLSGLLKATVSTVSVPFGVVADVIDAANGDYQSRSKTARAIENIAEGLGETTDGDLL